MKVHFVADLDSFRGRNFAAVLGNLCLKFAKLLLPVFEFFRGLPGRGPKFPGRSRQHLGSGRGPAFQI